MVLAPEHLDVDRGNDLPPLRHRADKARNFEYALCGVYRSRPLDLSLEHKPGEQFCVVCEELHKAKGGRSAA